MRVRLAAAGVLLALAAAAALTVDETTFGGLSGEVVAVDASFALLPGGVAVNALGVAAAGTSVGTAVELAAALATGSPGVAAGHYAYTATLQEASVGSVAGGTYAVELRLDGASKGTVYVAQGASDLLALEGASVAWDLGAAAPTGASVYELVVTPS